MRHYSDEELDSTLEADRELHEKGWDRLRECPDTLEALMLLRQEVHTAKLRLQERREFEPSADLQDLEREIQIRIRSKKPAYANTDL